MPKQDPRSALFIDAYKDGAEVLVILKGRLVLENCESARARLFEVLHSDIQKLYLYLGRLEFVDSSGWGSMVELKMAANRNQTSMYFLSPTKRVMDIFRITKLETIFEILNNEEAEEVRRRIIRRDNLLFRDTPDESQSRMNTEAGAQGEDSRIRPVGSASPPRGVPEAARDVKKLSRDAVEHLRQGELERAIDVFKRVIEINPDDLSSLNNLAVLYEKRPEWREQALATWNRVRSLSEKRNDAKHLERAEKHLEALRNP